MPEIGEKISRYTIISALGSGGMGRVYLAEDEKLGRRVALKFLSPELAADREGRERFLREARAASALNHPNICTIYEIDDSREHPFIAMEFVEGETLAGMIRRRRRTPRQTAEIGLQIAGALAEAHKKGVVHRDIKPANIVVTASGLVKILDFGLAKLLPALEAAGEPSFHTNAGVVLGTASYMSPEQARGLTVDGRTDIWSVGVCLYEMLTGRLPFKGDTAADTFAAMLTQEPDPPSAHTAGVPPELDAIVLRCMRRPRELRFQNAEELIAELQRVSLGLGRFEDAPSPLDDEPTEVFHTAPTEHNLAPSTDEGRMQDKTSPNNLTATFERIIGRENDIADVSRLLLNEGTRLVTLTGIGGTGKTTLSRAVARRMLPHFADGVFFIEMADVARPEVVASAIAQPLGVKEEGGRPLLHVLKDHLAGKQILLIVDNFEQVVNAAPQLAELIDAAPRLKLLVTSREILRVSAEAEFPVPPLDLPALDRDPTFDELQANEAVLLFTERARAARPTFTLTRENVAEVAAICSRLEGLPLAIELAAARVKVLSPGAILTKLENRLSLLAGGGRDRPERQKTMRGAMAWSYDLLGEEEKQVFRELSVFSGGFSVEAAEHVCDLADPIDLLDILASLIDRSLLSRKEGRDGEARFRMLEVVRDFAEELLVEAGEESGSKHRHAGYFVELAEQAEPNIQGAASDVWLARLRDEHDNLRAAMEWSLANAPDVAVRLAVAARNYWIVQSHLSEGFGWLKAAADIDFQPPPALRFKLLNGLGLAARFRGDLETARSAYERGLAAGMEAGDKHGTALSNRGLGLVAMQRGDHDSARAHFDEGLRISRELDDKYGIAMSLSFLGDLARTESRYADARPLFEEAVGLFRLLENKTAVGDALNNLGAAKYCLGETAEAAAHFSEALRSARELSNRITMSCSLDGLAALAVEAGGHYSAARLSGAAEQLRKIVGYTIEPAEAKLREVYVSKLEERLSEGELSRLAAEGASWPLETALNEAFGVAENAAANPPPNDAAGIIAN